MLAGVDAAGAALGAWASRLRADRVEALPDHQAWSSSRGDHGVASAVRRSLAIAEEQTATAETALGPVPFRRSSAEAACTKRQLIGAPLSL